MAETTTDPGLPLHKRLLFPVIAPLVAWLLRLFWLVCGVQHIEGEEYLEALSSGAGAIIPCHWHQRHIFCAYYLVRKLSGKFRIGYLVSPSKDGELGAMILKRLGLVAIRGSAKRTGAQAIRDLYLCLSRDGISPVLTPDGSEGPTYKFKPGPVMLAQLSGAPLVPMSYAARRAWYLDSWDRFMIPKPFTRVAIAIGRPRYVERSGKLGGTGSMQEQMEAELNRLGREAEAALER